MLDIIDNVFVCLLPINFIRYYKNKCNVRTLGKKMGERFEPFVKKKWEKDKKKSRWIFDGFRVLMILNVIVVLVIHAYGLCIIISTTYSRFFATFYLA